MAHAAAKSAVNIVLGGAKAGLGGPAAVGKGRDAIKGPLNSSQEPRTGKKRGMVAPKTGPAKNPVLGALSSPADGGIDQRLLTLQLRTIIRAIGVDLAHKLLQARGGTELRLPQRGDRSGVLVGLIGADAAQRLVEAFPGVKYLRLVKRDQILRQLRDAEIRAEDAAGKSNAEIAMKHDLTIRQVQIILATPPGEKVSHRFKMRGLNPGQRDLFSGGHS